MSQKLNEQMVSGLPLFRLAFRPFFWFGTLFGVVSISLWALAFSGLLQFAPLGGGFFWHTHEMLFGFTAAIISGFLLTAVQTWTGVPSIKGLPLAALFLLWLAARVLLIFPTWVGVGVTQVVDLLFLPVAAIALLIPIAKVKQWRNLMFVPILLFMACLNGVMHLSIVGKLAVSFITISHIMVLMVCVVMCIIGGRVFPMFTANGTGTPRVAPISWLEKLSIWSVVAAVVVTIPAIDLPANLKAMVYLVAGLANLARAWRWRIWVTFRTHLVWPLHLAYWSICIGLVMLSLQQWQILNSKSIAIHAITVGGISWMVLSMIARVSLGHTGRKILVGWVMALAFIFMGLAFMVRVFVPLVFEYSTHVVLASSAFWVAAMVIFLMRYVPVLFTTRVDGKPG
ncbi:NnrS family protein [Teredinibacter turnerae]|uniref:NnrS family protein n=1 Tax=Teredinibacter turnerae TaxID=2426 RepID=UPI000372B655|nr:NnrS family protein [Teredinibacter turnerae]